MILCWAFFAQDIKFYSTQTAAICVDGRLLGQPLEAGMDRVSVDDTKLLRKGEVREMRCAFQVAVYACRDEGLVISDWNGRCNRLESQPSFPPDGWPTRIDDNLQLFCRRYKNNCDPYSSKCDAYSTADVCTQPCWDCEAGQCDAYENSTSRCKRDFLRQDPYPCYTIFNDAKAGVREVVAVFPAKLLIGGIVSSLGLIGLSACCCFEVKRYLTHEEARTVSSGVDHEIEMRGAAH